MPFISTSTALTCDAGTVDSTCVINTTHDVSTETIIGTGSIEVREGGTLTTDDGVANLATFELDGEFYINDTVNGNFDITASDLEITENGQLRSDSRGYYGGGRAGYGRPGGGPAGGDNPGNDGAGGGHGGFGGRTDLDSSKQPYGSYMYPTTAGSGGGGSSGRKGGDGGGILTVNVSNSIIVNGPISANGANGGSWWRSRDAGGGAGGSILLEGDTITGSEEISSQGGNSGGGGGGGGSGGRIAFHVTTNNYNGEISVDPGSGQDADKGTIYPQTESDICTSGSLSTTCPVQEQVNLINNLSDTGDLVISSGGEILVYEKTDIDLAEVDIRSGGTIKVIRDIDLTGTNLFKVNGVLDTTGENNFDVNQFEVSNDGQVTTTQQVEFENTDLVDIIGSLTTQQGVDFKNTDQISVPGTLDAQTDIEATSASNIDIAGTLTTQNGGINFENADELIVSGVLEAKNTITANSATNIDIEGDITTEGLIDLRLAKTGTEIDLSNTALLEGEKVNITSENFRLGLDSLISVDGFGYSGGSTGSNGEGPGNGFFVTASDYGSGAGYGGEGGDDADGDTGGSTYGTIEKPTQPGSGGGGSNSQPGSAGGGVIFGNVTNDIVIDGTISADASDSNCGAGAGSGGAIWLNAGNLSGTGSVTANGGDSCGGGGSGGAGRIALDTEIDNYQGSVFTNGGIGGNEAGKAGSIYPRDFICEEGNLDSTCTITSSHAINSLEGNNLIVDGTEIYSPAMGMDLNFTDITLVSSGKITTSGDLNLIETLRVTLNTADLEVGNNLNWDSSGVLFDLSDSLVDVENIVDIELNSTDSVIELESSSEIKSSRINLTAENVSVNSQNTLNTRGLGFSGGDSSEPGSGPGSGVYGDPDDGTGASFGGLGGTDAQGDPVEPTYGSLIQPTQFGSGGGGSSNRKGGNGGGAIFINSTNELALGGKLTSRGQDPSNNNNYAGAGSGGSIWIVADLFSGNGEINAEGGTAFNQGGGGGGGRVAFNVTTRTFSGLTTVNGGSGNEFGEPGTIYPRNNICNEGTKDTTCRITSSIQLNQLEGAGTLELRNNAEIYAERSDIELNFSTIDIESGSKITAPQKLNLAGTKTFINRGDINAQGTISLENAERIRSSNIIESEEAIILENISDVEIASNKLQAPTINVTGQNLTLSQSGTLSTNYDGFAGGESNTDGSGPGGGSYVEGDDGSGGGYGRNGGDTDEGQPGGFAYGNPDEPIQFGSGGAGSSNRKGGNGGGSIFVNISDTITVDGQITSNGENGQCNSNNGAGGGSGGSIWIITESITGSTDGSITSNGGEGGCDGGGGSGGRISIESISESYDGVVQTNGGTSSYEYGSPGTVRPKDYLCDVGYLSTTCEINSYHHVQELKGNTLTVSTGTLFSDTNPMDLNFSSITIQNNGVIESKSDITINTTDKITVDGVIDTQQKLTVNSGDTLENRGNINAKDAFLQPSRVITQSNGAYSIIDLLSSKNTDEFTNDGNIDASTVNVSSSTISVNGEINTDGKGFPGGNDDQDGSGPGGGIYPGSQDGSGGSHGGIGAPNSYGDDPIPPVYGSLTYPSEFGSGGSGSNKKPGGNGGGIIHLYSENGIAIDGTISADGSQAQQTYGQGGGGGAGGSIYFKSDNLAGTGMVTANGGNGRSGGGGGAGGRIAADTTNNFDGNMYAKGGTGGPNGAPGTIHPQDYICDTGTLSTTCTINTDHETGRLNGTGTLRLSDGNSIRNSISSINISGFEKVELLGSSSIGSNYEGVEFNVTTLDLSSNAQIDTETSAKFTGIDTFNLDGNVESTNNISVSRVQNFNSNGQITARLLEGIDISSFIIDGSITTDRTNISAVSGEITSNGKIDTTDRGFKAGGSYSDGTGPGKGLRGSGNDASGGAHGGIGGIDSQGDIQTNTYGSLTQPTQFGSSGGRGKRSGGNGGGAIFINTSNTLTLNGNLLANGGNAGCRHRVNGGGGGAGGSIWTIADTLEGTGDMEANGGRGSCGGGDGSGGRIALQVENDGYDGSTFVNSGDAYRYAEAGTVYPDDFLCDQGNTSTTCTITENHHIQEMSGTGQLVVDDTGTLFSGNGTLNFDFSRIDVNGKIETYQDTGNGIDLKETETLIVRGSLLSDESLNATELESFEVKDGLVDVQKIVDIDAGNIDINGDVLGQKIFFDSARDIIVRAGNEISTNFRGFSGGARYEDGEGPGGGTYGGGNRGGAGGGYGGQGGDSSNSDGGIAYGTFASPDSMGSGGAGGRSTEGGAGGGFIKLRTEDDLQIDGTVSANGEGTSGCCDRGGGGSGGGIFLSSDSLTGAGEILSQGGDAGTGQGETGGGGGGRIVLYRSSENFFGDIRVDGGTGDFQNGEDGSIYTSPTDDVLGRLNVTLKDAEGNPISGKPVELKIAGESATACSYETDLTGKMSCLIDTTEDYDINVQLFSSDIQGRIYRDIEAPQDIVIQENTDISVKDVVSGEFLQDQTVTVYSKDTGNIIAQGETLGIFENFEDGEEQESLTDNTGWIQNSKDLLYNKEESAIGDTSVYTGDLNTGTPLSHKEIYPDNRKPEVIETWYREGSSSEGFGMTLRDENNNRVLGFGSDGPNFFVYDDANFNRNLCSSEAETWYKVNLTIDWESETFDFERSDGCTGTNFELRHTDGFQSIYVENQNGGNWGSSRINTWIDGIRIKPNKGAEGITFALEDEEYRVRITGDGIETTDRDLFRPDNFQAEVKNLNSSTLCEQTGDIQVSGECTITPGEYNVRSFQLLETGSIDIEAAPSQDSASSYGGVKIVSNGEIEILGDIDGAQEGYSTESGPGAGGSNEDGNSGAGYGGPGGDGGSGIGAPGGSAYGQDSEATRLGSGGGDNNGGFGGGSIWLESKSNIRVDGSINVDAEDGTQDAGGGSGGSIRMESPAVSGSGTLLARGGDGGDNTNENKSGAGGGSGGRLAIYSLEGGVSNFQVNLSGGKGGIGNETSGQDGEDGPTGTTYTGTITDPEINISLEDASGNQVTEDAGLTIYRTGTPYEECSSTPSDTGRFLCDVDPGQRYDIATAGFGGSARTLYNVSVPLETTIKENFNVSILDTNGNPVEGTDVYVKDNETNEIQCEGTTDEEGLMGCAVPEGSSYDVAVGEKNWTNSFDNELPGSVEIRDLFSLNILADEQRGLINRFPENILFTVYQTNSDVPQCQGSTNNVGRLGCSLDTNSLYDIGLTKYNANDDDRSYHPYSLVAKNVGVPQNRNIEIKDYLLEVKSVGSTGASQSDTELNVFPQPLGGLACSGTTNDKGLLYCGLDNDQKYQIKNADGLLERLLVNIPQDTVVQNTPANELINVSFQDELGGPLTDLRFRIDRGPNSNACEGVTGPSGNASCGISTGQYNLKIGDEIAKTDVESGNNYLIKRHFNHRLNSVGSYDTGEFRVTGRIWFDEDLGNFNENIDFWVDGEKITSTSTGSDGTFDKRFVYEEPGTHTLTLNYTDKYGLSDERKVTFGVTDKDQGIELINLTVEDGQEPVYQTVDVTGGTSLTAYPDMDGNITLALDSNNFYNFVSPLRNVSNIQPTADIPITPYAEVFVRDSNGDPVSGQRVLATRAGQTEILCDETSDSDGRAFCKLTSGEDYDIKLNSQTGTVIAKAQSPIQVTTGTSSYRGSIKYQFLKNNRELGDEIVKYLTGTTGERVCRGKTTSNGNFFCQPILDSKYDVVTSGYTGREIDVKKGLDPNFGDPITFDPGTNIHLVDITGNDVRSLEATVYETGTDTKACEGFTNSTGRLVCDLDESKKYDIKTSQAVERYEMQPPEETVVQVASFFNNKMLNLTLKGPDQNNLTDTDIKVTNRDENGVVACRGKTNDKGFFSCGIDRNDRYDISSEGQPLLANVEVPNQLDLGRNLEIKAVDSTGSVVQNAAFQAYNVQNDLLACSGQTNSEGILRCGLERDKEYRIESPNGVERYRVKMPERTTIEYSDDNEPVNMTFRNSTDQRMIDEGRIVIKNQEQIEVCSGDTNKLGEFSCGLNSSGTYQIETDLYNTKRQTIKADLATSNQYTIKPNVNVSLTNYTGAPATGNIKLVDNQTEATACYGETDQNGQLTCALEEDQTYNIIPYYNQISEGYTANITAPGEKALETIKFTTYDPDAPPGDGAVGINESVEIRNNQRALCTGYTGESSSLYCGTVPGESYSIDNPVKNVQDIMSNNSLQVGYGQTDLEVTALDIPDFGITDANFTYKVEVYNPGPRFAYDIDVNATASGSGWQGYRTVEGSLAPGERRNVSIEVFVPDGTVGTVKSIETQTNWTNPDLTSDSITDTGTIDVVGTGRLTTNSTIESILGEGSDFTKIGEVKLGSVGNEEALANYNVDGPESWEFGFDPFPSPLVEIPIGDTKNISVFAKIPESELQGTYNATLNIFEESRKDDEANITVYVPPSAEFERTPDSLGTIDAPLGTSGDVGTIDVKNTGNQNVTFTVNKEIGEGSSTFVKRGLTTFELEPLEEREVDITYQVPADSTGGEYEYNITLSCSPGCGDKKTDLTLDVRDLPPSIDNYSFSPKFLEPSETIEWNINASDNDRIDRVWVDILGQENITAETAGELTGNPFYTANFTPQEESALYDFRIYAQDSGDLTTRTDVKSFQVIPQTDVETTLTQTVFTMPDVTVDSGDTVNFNATFTNNGDQKAYNVSYEMQLPDNFSSSTPNLNVGDLESGESKTTELEVTVSAGVSPSVYLPTIRTDWENADESTDSSEISFKADVLENIDLRSNISTQLTEMEQDSVREFNITLSSEGNEPINDINGECASGDGCENLFYTFFLPDRIPVGEQRQAKVRVEADLGTPDGQYDSNIEIGGEGDIAELSNAVTVNKDLSMELSTNNYSQRVGPGTQIALENLSIRNNGNQPLEVAMPESSNIEFDPTGYDLDIRNTKESSIELTAPETPGDYEYNLTVAGFDRETFERIERFVEFSIRVFDYSIDLENVENDTEITDGEEITLTTNVEFEGSSVTSDMDWDVEIGNKEADVVSTNYNSGQGVWEVNVEAPDIEQGNRYDLEVQGTYDSEEITTASAYTDRIEYADLEAPVYTDVNAEDIEESGSSRISLRAQDKGEIESVRDINATIETPGGTNLTLALEESGDQWVVNTPEFDQEGYYEVYLTSSDTAGNMKTERTFFQLYETDNIQGEIKTPEGEGLDIEVTLQKPDTKEEIDQFYTSNGNYSRSVKSGTYDVVLDINNSQMVISLQDVPHEELNDPLDMDPFIPNAYVDVPISSNDNELTGVAIKTKSLQDHPATVGISYSGYIDQIKNVRDLGIYKCDSWSFENQQEGCGSDWTKKDTAVSPATETVFVSVDSFSSFYLTEFGGSDEEENVTAGDGSTGNSTEENGTNQDIVDAIEGLDTGGGGGGGGGGIGDREFEEGIESLLGALNDTEENDTLQFSGERIVVEVAPGQRKTASISVSNNIRYNQTLDIGLTGDIQRFVDIEDEVRIDGNSQRDIELLIAAAEDTETGSYSGFVTIEGEAVSKQMPVNIEVVEPAETDRDLLDLEIETVVDNIVPGENLRIKTSMLNQGYTRNVDVDLNISVRDPDTGDIINRKTTTVAVSTTLDKIFEIKIPEDIELKRYEVEASVSYSNIEPPQTANAIQTFVVDKPFWDKPLFGMPRKYIAGSMIIFLFLSLASYSGYLYYRKKLLENQRYQEDLDVSTLPSGGSRQAHLGKLAEHGSRSFLELEEMTTHTLIAGATGSGKTVTGQGIVEEALKEGTNVIVLDPTAQWSGFLRESNETSMLEKYSDYGMSKNEARGFDGNIRAIEPGEELDITEYLETDDEGQIIVFSMHKLDSDRIDEFVDTTIQQVFDANLPESGQLDTLIVYDEVHRLLEKFGGSGKGLKQLERGAREFRKWGVGMILLSQVISDFSGEIRANIGTTIQMRSQYEGDLKRMENKYGMDTVKSIVKANVGSGMLQNSDYNHGKPYFVDFRPLLHSPHRLSDEKLEKYEHYNQAIDTIKTEIEKREEKGEDMFELKSELRLAKKNLRKGSFNLVKIYIKEIKENLN